MKISSFLIGLQTEYCHIQSLEQNLLFGTGFFVCVKVAGTEFQNFQVQGAAVLSLQQCACLSLWFFAFTTEMHFVCVCESRFRELEAKPN